MTKILLVEDNELNRDMLSRRLRRRGYELSIAVDGAEAIAIASAQTFDLILMDMSLPVMDGWEATRRLKAQPHTQKVPIIALTAHAMRGDRDQALAAGCDDYDTKPIDLKRLLSKIKSFLSSEQLADTSSTPKPIKTKESPAAPVIPIKPITPIATPTILPISATTSETPVTPINPEPFPNPSVAPEVQLPSGLPAAATPSDDLWTTPSPSSKDELWTTPSTDELWSPPLEPTSLDVAGINLDVSKNEPPASPITANIPDVASDATEVKAPATLDDADVKTPIASEKKKNIFSGLPILVVDDNEDNRDMLSRRLTRRGYLAVVVESGEAALDYIATHADVALVLLDIMMPGIDGIETLKRIRKNYSRQQLPVLMVTAKAQSDDMVKAFELGANDYITKPIDFAVTLARVETQLAIVKATKVIDEPPRSIRRAPEVAAKKPSAPPSTPLPVTSEKTAEKTAPSEPQPTSANISLVPDNTTFSRFAADRYQVQYFLRQEPLGPLSIALDKHTDSLVLLQTLKAYSQDTADLLKRIMEKETEAFQPLRSLFPGYTYGQVGNTFYIVHGLGDTFHQEQLLQAKLQNPWPLESVLLLMDRLLEQVSVFHRHNQIHTGLRDDCFIQTNDWETKGQSMVLVDSGLGKRVMIGVSQQSAEYRKQLLMQRDYQPLEQRIARPVMSSDVYALGLIGLQALTGQSIDQLTMPSVSGELQWRQFTTIPDPIAEWFEQLIHQSQNKRFGHAMAARNALTPHLQTYMAEPG
ncbi:MAG: response regulator [Cyanobacteria bacterium P01_D01_bin.156]